MCDLLGGVLNECLWLWSIKQVLHIISVFLSVQCTA